MVENVKVVVMISLPFLRFKEAKASKFADEPEFTIKPNFFPNDCAIFFSKDFTEGPSIKVKDLFLKH